MTRYWKQAILIAVFAGLCLGEEPRAPDPKREKSDEQKANAGEKADGNGNKSAEQKAEVKAPKSTRRYTETMTPAERVAMCQAVFRRLERNVSCDFDKVKLQEVVTFIQLLCRCGMILDPTACTEGAARIPVSSKYKDVPLGLLLNDVVSRAGLDWTLHNSIYISTPARIAEIHRKYPEIGREVAKYQKEMRKKADELSERIQRTD